MSRKYETRPFDTLVAEQEVVQARKFQGRILAEYSRCMFPGQEWRIPCSSAVTDFVRPLCASETVSLDGVLQGMYVANGEMPISWVDMGGGRGLPMRQLANTPEFQDQLTMTNVDFFEYGLKGLEQSELDHLEVLSPGITDVCTAPRHIRANVETVTLPEPAHVITSVETVQYLNNPLVAMSNWYNQLADNGLLVISTQHDWASWLRYQREPGSGDREETPTKHLLSEFSRAGVAYAATDDSDWEHGRRPRIDPSCFRSLVVQKKPHTQMHVTSDAVKVWVNPYDFKAVYYEELEAGVSPVVVVASD